MKLGAFLIVLGLFCWLVGCAKWQLRRGYERGRADYYRDTVDAFGAGWFYGFYSESQKDLKAKEILKNCPKMNNLIDQMPYPIEVGDE